MRSTLEQEELLARGLWDQTRASLRLIEEQTASAFGNPENPCLVWVRSGANTRCRV